MYHTNNNTCPSCGHCPTCGRGGYQFTPYTPYYIPYMPSYPNWGGSIPMTGTNTVTTFTSTALNANTVAPKSI